ncbi:MAG: hypothetical protein JOZ46_02300 [Candidatus Dormibacteraeota bacterium]|nr:hypothetical protein [Candidatus Dormibacteraeota bacterium]MBV9524628.1 hypothetical protein [Candidatus Dormibacteraeota bacterium]
MSGIADMDSRIAAADSEFPALFQLFGGYFHQDWRQEHATPAAALTAFIEEAPPEAVRAAAAELQQVLDLDAGDAALTRLLREGFDCNYRPEEDGMTPSAWLRAVAARLQPAG